MTRPRIAGSTPSCTAALARAWNARLTAPIAARTTRNAVRPGISDAATWAMPKPAAVATIGRRRREAAPPATSAPAADPTASTTLNSP